jgi:hypothetical protein
MKWLINNIYVVCGDSVFRQVIGIPMGTDCAPFLANLYLYSYKYQRLVKKYKNKEVDILRKFNYCFRYIDDLICINNDQFMDSVMKEIYPKKLPLAGDNTVLKAHYLDLDLDIVHDTIEYKLFDTCDAFGLSIVHVPGLSGNIPNKQSYGVFVSQLIRYARCCQHLKDVVDRTKLLIDKLTNQGFKRHLLKNTSKKFSIEHYELLFRYNVPSTSIFCDLC